MTNLELVVERKLSQNEVEKIYDIINKYAIIEHIVTLNESDGYADVESQIQIMQEGNSFEYSILLKQHTDDSGYNAIVNDIAKLISDDFEFGVFTPQ